MHYCTNAPTVSCVCPAQWLKDWKDSVQQQPGADLENRIGGGTEKILAY